VIGVNAWDGESLAAHYVVTPIRAALAGRELPAALSLNTATHPNYQRRGLFVRLAEATYAAAREQGIDHVIGVANANSTPGFLNKLAFRDLGRLDAVIGLGLPALGDGPPVTEASWRRVWSADELEWRLRNPAGDYRRQRAPHGAAVLSATVAIGVQAVLCMEEDPERCAAIERTVRAGAALGARLWIGRSRRIRPAAASMELPERFRRSPLNLIYRSLNNPAATPDAATVEFQAIDFDAF
jgi:hypothetical protein